MLSKPADDLLNGEEWRQFLRVNGFGQVIAPGKGLAVPVVTPLHFALGRDDEAVFHVHRANPLVAALRENPSCLLAVIGSYVYIPAEWNAAAGEDPRWGVPTSYYAAVQAACNAEVVEDEWDLAGILSQLMEHYEPRGSRHHEVEPGDSPYGKLLGAIVGVRLRITRVRGKFKFGGNRDSAHRLRVAERLAGRNGPLDASARAHVLRRDAASRGVDEEADGQ